MHCTANLYRTVRQLTNADFKITKPLKDENSELTTSKDKQIHIWEHYYKKLLSASSQHIQPCDCQRLTINRDIPAAHPDESRIINAIKSLKSIKAPEPNNINTELLQTDPKISTRILQPLLKTFWNSGKIPT